MQFYAETHHKFLATFNYFKVDFCKWVMCENVDKVSVSVKIGVLIGKPTIVCNDHLLQVDINLMVADMPQLKQVLNDDMLLRGT